VIAPTARSEAGQPEPVAVRRWAPGDEREVLELLGASLGWVPDDMHSRFFRWKHQQSSFGPSPAWVAVLDGQIVGFRVFLRWELDRPGGGPPVRAVRAVDTATHPRHQGRGIFSQLTLHALGELSAEGVELVFNTPNDRSRPGYLKMGWCTVGRLPVRARPRSVRSLIRVMRARVPAEKWTVPTTAGQPAHEVLAQTAALGTLLERRAEASGLATHLTPAHLEWRYGFEPLGYRAVTAGQDPSDGVVIFRLRRRGGATEAVLCELLVPAGRRDVARNLASEVLHRARPDYLVGIGGRHAGLVPLPRQGPVLVCRGLRTGATPAGDGWALTMGDVELM
jgi:GNAT superfamily N-acetyltransferase